MTQQPNEQQDALVALVAKAIRPAHGESHLDFPDEDDLWAAEAALKAVRLEHVIIPRAMAEAILAGMKKHGWGSSADALEKYLTKEPHGRAGGGDA